MDPVTNLLVRMSMWVRHPPAPRTAIAMLVALLLAFAVVGVERYIGWPDWAHVERVPMIRR